MKAVVFDVDGTLADIAHRVHHVSGEKKDFDSFNTAMISDTPYESICNLANVFAREGYYILICTGRFEKYRGQTLTQLFNWNVPLHQLYMRGHGDYRSDVDVKREMIDFISADDFEIKYVFEDRERVVQMWRDEGYACLQVKKGDY